MIAIIDIETTGLDPCVHEVIEVGAIFAEHGNVIDEQEFSLPFDVDRADPKALEINGWGKRDFPTQIGLEEAADTLERWFTATDYITSWHVTLDVCFLDQFMRRQQRRAPWNHRRIIDMPSLALGRMGILARGAEKDIRKQLGLNPEWEGQHSALDDARSVFEVYEKLRLWEMHS